MLSRLRNIKQGSTSDDYSNQHISFSQSGEDLIIKYILKNHLGVDKPSYLDIGAYDPTYLSNTYLFYKEGLSGVLVEPDPDLAKKIQDVRTRDTVLNIGVSKNKDSRDFYLMTPATLNTFSSKEYEQYRIFHPDSLLRGKVKTRTLPINDILKKHFSDKIDILSLDVEGLDYEILSSINFSRYRPSVICVETVEYKNGDTYVKPKDVASLLYKNSYFMYADTFINSIFVDKHKWDSAKQPKLVNFGGSSKRA